MIDKYEDCPCGSENKYKWCCFAKADKPFDIRSQKHFEFLLKKKLSAAKFKQCLHPNKIDCSGGVINAHSIQNNRILSSLARNGHVLMFTLNGDDESTGFIPKRRGRNDATTFSGFCNFHDTSTFLPIERDEFLQSDEQKFLFAYRAFALIFHKKQEQLRAFQQAVSEVPASLKIPYFVDYYRGLRRSEQEFYADNFILSEALINGAFDKVYTKVFEFNYNASVAVCSGFFIKYDLNSNQIAKSMISANKSRESYLYFNAFPQNGKTYILMSCLSRDYLLYENLYNQLSNLDEKELGKYFSRTFVYFVENIVFSQDFWDGQNKLQKDQIQSDFEDTIMVQKRFPSLKHFIHDLKYNFFGDV